MFNHTRLLKFAVLSSSAVLLSGCQAVTDALPSEPSTPANLVIESIQLGDGQANTVTRAKVGTPVRVRLTVRNDGGTTAPASVSRAYINNRRVADFATPEVRRNARVTVEADVLLERELLGTLRDLSSNHSLDVCLNATGTVVQMGQESVCQSTRADQLLILPNFELDCSATAVQVGTVASVSPGAPACRLASVVGDAQSVRFLSATGAARFSVEVSQPDASGAFYAAVMSEDGGVITTFSRTGATTRHAFNVSLPGRYYLAVNTSRPFTKRVTAE